MELLIALSVIIYTMAVYELGKRIALIRMVRTLESLERDLNKLQEKK